MDLRAWTVQGDYRRPSVRRKSAPAMIAMAAYISEVKKMVAV
jgi:hypothetical protein